MANEAVIIELLGDAGDVKPYTVADGTGISKGSLMVLTSDPNTITKSENLGEAFVGIASVDKEAGDGSTRLGVWTNLVADLTQNGDEAATVGDFAVISGANLIGAMGEGESALSAARMIVGQYEETATASEVVRVYVHR